MDKLLLVSVYLPIQLISLFHFQC